MKKNKLGFATVEVIIAAVIVLAVAGVGYYVWHSKQVANTTPVNKTATTVSTPAGSYKSPTTKTPVAPQVTNAASLNTAMNALNQTSISSSNVDSNQLSTQASAF